VKVFEVYGDLSGAVDEKDELYSRTYHDGFEAYLSKDFQAARHKFQEALSMRMDDPASREMIERIDGLNPQELPMDWDGSIALTSK
jgi:hypothetical protein